MSQGDKGPCPACGTTLRRRQGESPSDFRNRIHCNDKCARSRYGPHTWTRSSRTPAKRSKGFQGIPERLQVLAPALQDHPYLAKALNQVYDT